MNKTKLFFSLKDFFKLIRWGNLVIILITQLFVAIFLIGPPELWKEYLSDFRFWFIILSTVCIAAAGYIINDYYDVKIDIINKPSRMVIGRKLSRRQALTTHFSLNILGILLGFIAGIKIGLINGLATFFLWWYSNSLKRLPLVGNIAVSLLTATSLIVVGLYFENNFDIVLYYSVFAFFVSLIREIVKDMEDVKGDQTHGCLTLPIKFGIRKSKKVIYSIQIIFAISLLTIGYYQNSILLIYFNFMIIVPLLFFSYKLSMADTRKDFTYLSTFCKMIMICGVFSMFFI